MRRVLTQQSAQGIATDLFYDVAAKEVACATRTETPAINVCASKQ